jgi:hypothetical protein
MAYTLYHKRVDARCPKWANRKAIHAIYDEAAQLRAEGHDVVVDHIVPITHPYVSGLHVPANLRIYPRLANHRKSNRVWPGMWGENEELGLGPPLPSQALLFVPGTAEGQGRAEA